MLLRKQLVGDTPFNMGFEISERCGQYECL